MIIELVDDTRLFILLAREDMQFYDITFEMLDWHDSHSRKIITKLLRIAHSQTGFSTRGKRLKIEAIPGGNSCMLLITLLSVLAQKQRKKYKIKGSPVALPPPSTPVIYKFEDVEALFAAVGRLYHLPCYKETITVSRLLLYKESYRLLLYARGALPSEIKVLLTEYGEYRGRSTGLAAYLSEHGTVLAQNSAVEEIGKVLG